MCCHKLVDLPLFLKGRSDSRELPNYIFLTSKSCLSKKISNLSISLRFSLTWLLIVRKMNSPLRFYVRSRGSKGYSHSPLRRFAPRCVAYLTVRRILAASLRSLLRCNGRMKFFASRKTLIYFASQKVVLFSFCNCMLLYLGC